MGLSGLLFLSFFVFVLELTWALPSVSSLLLLSRSVID